MGTSIDQPGPGLPGVAPWLGDAAVAERKTVPAAQHFALIDVETTDLEPDARLLELGLFVMRFVDDGKTLGWVVDQVIHRVFYYKPHTGDPLPVFEAHLHNGLLKECASSAEHPWHLDEELSVLVPEKSIPVGRNVHFDIKVLQKHMPALAARFHYRHLDLTPLEMQATSDILPPKIRVIQAARAKSTHRALQDCVQELMALRDLAFMPRRDLRDPGPSA